MVETMSQSGQVILYGFNCPSFTTYFAIALGTLILRKFGIILQQRLNHGAEEELEDHV
jgi:hypothetical protein